MSSFNENDLIAFHLHELSPQRARELHAALESDPRLAAESAAIAATLSELRAGGEAPAMTAAGLAAISDHHWQRLRPALVEARGSAFGWWKPFSLGTLCGLVLPSLFFLFHAAAPAVLPPPSPPGVAAGGGAAAPAPQAVPVMGEHGGRGTGGAAGGPVRWRVATCAVAQPQTEVAERGEQKLRIANEPGETLAPPQIASFDWRESLPLPATRSAATAVPPAVDAEAEPPAVQLVPVKQPARHHPFSVTAAAFGNLTVGRSANSIDRNSSFISEQSETVSEDSAPGAVISIETPITRRLGVRLDAAEHPSVYSSTSGFYLSAPHSSGTSFAAGTIRTTQYEVSPSAVLAFPTQTRVLPYVQVGAGMLVFKPHDNPGLSIPRSYRASGLVGAGVKVNITAHLALTAGYRGVIYRTPYFTNASPNSTGISAPVLVRRTLSSQPFVGLTYTFGGRRKD